MCQNSETVVRCAHFSYLAFFTTHSGGELTSHISQLPQIHELLNKWDARALDSGLWSSSSTVSSWVQSRTAVVCSRRFLLTVSRNDGQSSCCWAVRLCNILIFSKVHIKCHFNTAPMRLTGVEEAMRTLSVWLYNDKDMIKKVFCVFVLYMFHNLVLVFHNSQTLQSLQP